MITSTSSPPRGSITLTVTLPSPAPFAKTVNSVYFPAMTPEGARPGPLAYALPASRSDDTSTR
jgi:hypothetical protein